MAWDKPTIYGNVIFGAIDPPHQRIKQKNNPPQITLQTYLLFKIAHSILIDHSSHTIFFRILFSLF